MKKISVIAALAGIVLVSCQKEESAAVSENGGRQEIAITAFSKGFTKSVLGSGNSFDGSERTIIAAGAMKTEGKWVDFLGATNFTESEGSKWTATPKVYYPLGGADADFKFLAYSESKDHSTSARWYGSMDVEISLDEKCDTNEIVYAGFHGLKQGAATAIFKHSQALVTVYIRTNQDTIKINRIGFEDVKTSGILSLKRLTKDTEIDTVAARWIFSSGCNCKFAEMGDYYLTGASASPYNVPAGENFFTKYVKDTPIVVGGSPVTGEFRNEGLGTWINSTGCIFDRLFPAQELDTKTLIINYTLGKLTADARLTFSDTNPTVQQRIYKWEAGKRYVYEITVKPAEIVLDPSVEDAWELKTITGVYGDDSDVDEPAFSFTSGNGNESSPIGETSGWY